MKFLKFLQRKKKRISQLSHQKSNHLLDVEPWQWELIEYVKPYTMTSPERILALIQATKYILKYGIEGDFVECGSWKGGSAMVMAKVIMQENEQRNLWLYDTFEGMSPPTDHDKDIRGLSAKERLIKEEINKQNSWLWAVASFDEVRKNLVSINFPDQNLIMIKGKVEETLLNNKPEKISLLRIDTDWYESTKVELEQLFPLVSPKGIIIIDDYGHWSGCRKAVDEYFFNKNIQVFLNRIDYTGRLIIKP